jgi:Myb-like DNA-binding protein FlbD
MSLVQNQGALNWVRIASILGTRTPKQCRERYHQNLKPSLNHEPITAEEGLLIERLVLDIGKRWAEIARRLHGRSDNAVKNWWNGSQNRRKRMDRRKATHLPYDRDLPVFARQGLVAPRGLPFPAATRPLPPPLLPISLHKGYTIDTPLPSPSIYSPESDVTPSLTSDSGSHYSTSPRGYENRSPDLELPPLKIPAFSPRSPPSPKERQLPPIKSIDIVSPAFPHSPGFVHSPHSPPFPRSPEFYKEDKISPVVTSCEYLSPKSQLLTAPNSPDAFSRIHIRPYHRERDARVAVASLVS